MALFFLLSAFLLQSVDILYPSDRSLLRQGFGEQVERSGGFEVDEEYLVEDYTVEDGLPVNSINQIIQDHDGYLWFSSLDGLTRYDGYEFKVYTSANTEGLQSNRIGGMFLSDQNELFLAHEDASLTIKTGISFKTYDHILGEFNGYRGWITQDSDGQIWISTGNGIARLDRETLTFEEIESPLFRQQTWGIQALSDGSLLVVNNRGLIQWDSGISTLLLKGEDFSFERSMIIRIKQFDPGSVWLLGNKGFFQFSMEDKVIMQKYSWEEKMMVIWDMIPDEDGSFLVSTAKGFYQLFPDTQTLVERQPQFIAVDETFRRYLVFEGKNNEEIRLGDKEIIVNGKTILSTPRIRSSIIDTEGTLWISTVREGIFKIRKSQFSNITQDRVPGLSNIYSILHSSDGATWAGSFGNGIYRISGNSITHWTEENSQLFNGIIRLLFEDMDGTMYAGIWGQGLWKQTNNDWERVREPDPLAGADVTVEAMYRDSQNRLFIGSHKKLIVKNRDRYSYFNTEKTEFFTGVRAIREDDKGTLYFGTREQGLTIVRDDTIQNFTEEDGILNSRSIRDVYIQSEDTIWVANESNGLNRLIFNKNNNLVSTASVTVEDGLINNSLHRIIESPDRHLWISSNGGIMSIPKSELNLYADGELAYLSVMGFTEKDGMSNREANGGVNNAGFLSADQKLWFPNQNGIIVIDPSQFMLPVSKPLIEEISFSDGALSTYGFTELKIPSGERNIRISFSSPNFSAPELMQLRYKLEGVNQDWEDATQSRQAVLTNIPPGRHQFQLSVHRAGNPNDVSEASIFIIIPYFFYETTWFKMLLGLLGALVILGSIKYRTRVLEERERQLQERVAQQTLELQKAAEQKSRFFSGITHELKTPLSLIVSPLEDLMENPGNISEKAVQQRFELMHRNGQRLQNLVDQILDVTKLNSDAMRLTLRPVNITELTRQIAGQFHSMLEMEDIELVFESDSMEDFVYADPGAWEHIVINLLSNAIRFSPRGSSIYVTVKEKDDAICLSVKDEGTGIDEKEQDNVFEYLYQVEGDKAAEGTGIGLYLVKGLVDCMGGRVELVSRNGEGAEFIITLQKGYYHFRDTDTIVHEPFISTPPKNGKAFGTNVKIATLKHANPNASHILVTEDNHDYRNYLQSTISAHYQVTTASEGVQALEILKKINVDLVISDVMMPGMNGLEFVNILRKKEGYKHLPVIFLSAKNQGTDIEEGLSTGADIYLTKPIKSSLLLSQIAAVLRREDVLKSNQLVTDQGEENELVKNLSETIYRQLGNPALSINLLADSLFMSRSSLYREWKKVSDTSLNDFIKQVRLKEAKILLSQKGFSVQETAQAVGYMDPNYFSNSFKKEYGVSPSDVMK